VVLRALCHNQNQCWRGVAFDHVPALQSAQCINQPMHSITYITIQIIKYKPHDFQVRHSRYVFNNLYIQFYNLTQPLLCKYN
jgi:hypothetical protein